jgi:hypothetical protein
MNLKTLQTLALISIEHHFERKSVCIFIFMEVLARNGVFYCKCDENIKKFFLPPRRSTLLCLEKFNPSAFVQLIKHLHNAAWRESSLKNFYRLTKWLRRVQMDSRNGIDTKTIKSVVEFAISALITQHQLAITRRCGL